MQVDQLKLLGLPVLEAQLKLHNVLLDAVLSVARTKKLSVRMALSIITDQDEQNFQSFAFPSPECIPAELQTFLEGYGNRLVSERMKLEVAIEELREELSWYSLTKFCNS